MENIIDIARIKRKRSLFHIMFKRWLALSIILMIPGCRYGKFYDHRKQFLKRVFFAGPIPEGPATIFIHGTKESVLSKLVHRLDYPFGVVPAATVRTSSVLSRIAFHLDESDPLEFGRERFYFYGWHGKLNFPSRIKAAEKLYGVIKDHKGPLTIMAHSHGCSVALHLAEFAQKENNKTLKIDRLIFLAPPVQMATKQLVHSPLFKEVYTFYSTADFIQIGDPQGLYWESYAYTPINAHIPFLSMRTFDPAPNIMQTRIMIDRQSPGHLNFMLGNFVKHIPRIMKMVKHRAQTGGYEETRNFYLVNIPPCGLSPEFLRSCDIQKKYVPRTSYYKAKRIVCLKKDSSCELPQPQNTLCVHH